VEGAVVSDFDDIRSLRSIGDRVLKDILDECIRQYEKWGEQNHPPCEWIAILGEEFGEAARQALNVRFTPDDANAAVGLKDLRCELIQCAAVAASAVACIDRKMGREPTAWGSPGHRAEDRR
jgi:hypothetical protein